MTFTLTPSELIEFIELAANKITNPLLEQIMTNVQGLLDAVNKETTVDQSILTLLDQIIGQNKQLSSDLAAAIAANDPVAMQAVQDAIDKSVATMTANAAAISTAVTNNTPPAPPAPPAS